MSEEKSKGEILRTARARRDKVIRFEGNARDNCRVTWYVAYRGKYGWVACRGTGEWVDDPSDADVEAAVREYDVVELVDRSETPGVVEL